jgi:outer membrane protein TolC
MCNKKVFRAMLDFDVKKSRFFMVKGKLPKWQIPLGGSQQNRAIFNGLLAMGLCITVVSTKALAQQPISLEKAIAIAQANDPWLAGLVYQQEAIQAQSVAVGQLPDPEIAIGVANLPTDSFDFGQEPMTQFRLGVKQLFPRGASLALKQRQLAEMSEQYPYMRSDRMAKIAVMVAHLWLEAFRNRETFRLIESDRRLFESLLDIAQAKYAAALGNARQQDLIRAQLELTRIDDQIVNLHQQYEMNLAKLGEWLITVPDKNTAGFEAISQIELDNQLPRLMLAPPETSAVKNSAAEKNAVEISATAESLNPQQLFALLEKHPAILMIEQKVTASGTGIDLAKQHYKPQWGVSADYGYRDRDPLGRARADFFSMGVSFDIPVFTAKRQDKNLQAAIANTEAMKTEKAQMLRSMKASFESTLKQYKYLSERQAIYQTRLLGEINDQAEASLTAYANDDGDFGEVVRAHIAELNAQIEALNIAIDRLKSIAQINYFFVADDLSKSTDERGDQL